MEHTRVRVPQLQNVEQAVRMYYERVELSASDIMALFHVSRNTATKLKAKGREVQAEKAIPSWNATCVHTASAFEAWGLDIADLENRLQKLRRLKLREVHNAES